MEVARQDLPNDDRRDRDRPRHARRHRGDPLRIRRTVGYFPERYGQELVELAQALYAGEPVEESVYIEHEWVDASNIRDHYPNC